MVAAMMFVSEMAYSADWTSSMTMVQSFGCCSEGLNYKIMLKSSSGTRWFVWYPDKLEAPVGSTIIVTGDGDYWEKLTYTPSGRESSVAKVLKVE